MAILRFDALSLRGVYDLLHDMAGARRRRQKGKEEVGVEHEDASSRAKRSV